MPAPANNSNAAKDDADKFLRIKVSFTRCRERCTNRLRPEREGQRPRHMKTLDCNQGAMAGFAAPYGSTFRCIVADPPWKYGAWGKASKPNYTGHVPKVSRMPYQTMTVDEIKALPVAAMAADDCDLYLWTTQKYLPDAFGVLDAWGFRYCQTLTWCKTPMGTGQGGLYCPTTEFCLLGRKGKMPLKKRVDTTWWNWPRAWKTHSRKPEAFQDLVEAVSYEPRLELFARRKRHGWASWGNEIANDVEMPNDKDQATRQGHAANT